MPRGRPKGTTRPKKASTKLAELKRKGDLTLTKIEGHEIELQAKVYRHYAYNKNGQKYHSLINRNDPNFSFRGIPEQNYQYHLVRLGRKDPMAYDKLWIYSKEGTLWRAENARKGILARFEKQFNSLQTFNINGQVMRGYEIRQKLIEMQNTQAWIDTALDNAKTIQDYFENLYLSEPEPDAGEKPALSMDDIVSDVDDSVVAQGEKEAFEKLISRLLR